jgi:allantoinase
MLLFVTTEKNMPDHLRFIPLTVSNYLSSLMTNGIYSNRCWVDGKLQEATIHWHDGTITKVEKSKPSSFDDIINAGDQIVMPGLIDAHVHVNEPGRTEWEGFDTATQAAAAGGITTIVDMPLNASPVTTNKNAFLQKLASTKNKLHVNCGFYGGLIPGNQNELGALIEEGVLGIKAFLTHSGIDEFPNVSQQDLDSAMPLIAQHGIPLLVHCELSDETTSQQLSKNPTSYQSFLASRPRSWENRAIALIIELCRQHQCPVHIVHVSSSEALPLIHDAKSNGLPVTAETCPQYIYFNSEEIADADCLFKCAPPIRERINNGKLKEALKNGTLDFIATDHSPAPADIKEINSGNLQKAWGGIAGLQFLLAASWSALKDTMPIEKFIPLVTEHPAKFLQIENKTGFIREGYDADLAIWLPEESFEVKQSMIFHKHKISPYVSRNLFGKVHHTIVNGKVVFSEGKIIQKNAGTWVLKK